MKSPSSGRVNRCLTFHHSNPSSAGAVCTGGFSPILCNPSAQALTLSGRPEMSYTFQFGVIAQYQDALLAGIWLTIKLSVMSIVLGCAGGILFASLRSMNNGIVSFLINAYVEIIRNTPFLVQLFIIYFGLPAIGLRVGAETAALIGMTINLTAYSTEIIRAGIEAVHKSQIEAGEALGFTRLQIYRHVIILPALAK